MFYVLAAGPASSRPTDDSSHILAPDMNQTRQASLATCYIPAAMAVFRLFPPLYGIQCRTFLKLPMMNSFGKKKKKLFRLETKSVRSPRSKTWTLDSYSPTAHDFRESLPRGLRSTFVQSFPAPTAPTARNRSWQGRDAQEQRVRSIPPRHPDPWKLAQRQFIRGATEMPASAGYIDVIKFFFVAFA